MLALVITSVAMRHWPLTTFIIVIAYVTSNYFNHHLNKYPGPFLASLTDWWRFFEVYGKRSEVTHIKLHQKHGDVVRLGPNVLSFADPAAINQIYGLKKGFVKVFEHPNTLPCVDSHQVAQSGFYPVQMAVSKGNRLPSLFSTTDEVFHANLRRSVNSAFTMSALVKYEPFVDEVVEVFFSQTDKIFAQPNKICDFAEWLQFFAFDVIGQITYSKRHGFIDRCEDVDGIVKYLGRLFSYAAPVRKLP
jgi:cytochrome P450